jgi:glutamine phosphoribosylpyrophosphate amidotransferase
MGLVSEVFHKEDFSNLKGNIGVGHVRYSTTGGSVVENAQPIAMNYIKGSLALVHNGNIVNANELKEKQMYRGISDVYILWHGEWADPELSYQGKVVNYWDVEETVIDWYREERQSMGLSVIDDYNEFLKYFRNHTSEIKQLILDIYESSK